MKRILLDENIPVRLKRLLPDENICHVHEQGWTGLSNGKLIAEAEKSGFDVLLTADRNLRYQQNLQGRHLALVVLPSNNWNLIQRNLGRIAQAIHRAEPGTYHESRFDRSRA